MNKPELKSLMIGFLLSSCIFLFMGNISGYGSNEVLKVELVGSRTLDVNIKDLPSYSKLDVNIKDFPSWDELRVKVVN